MPATPQLDKLPARELEAILKKAVRQALDDWGKENLPWRKPTYEKTDAVGKQFHFPPKKDIPF